MNYKDYSALKSASKVVFKKEGDAIILEQKRWNQQTGEETTPAKETFYLEGLESEKTNFLAKKTNLEAKLVEINKMITDVKAL